MSNFSKYIPEDLAKELLRFGMPLLKCNVIPDMISIDCGPKDAPSIAYEMRIPTYGEVIDWFSSKGIYITFDAFFTFALADNVGYLWKISFIEESNGDKKLKNIFEVDVWNGKEGYGGSFELDANDAIMYAMNLKKSI